MSVSVVSAPVGSLALGLVELRGESAGLQLLDAAVKNAGIDSAFGSPVCPGKFLVFLTGTVADVRSALALGTESGAQVTPLVLPSVHPDVWPALTGTTRAVAGDALAIMETSSAVSAVAMADEAAKDVGIQLLRIRLASGLGGKGLVFFSGPVAELHEAAAVARRVAGDHLLDGRVLSSPHPRLWEFVL
ncbi:MAG: BMC domain-containing protein [Limnochordia bacterium]|jgi:microcompartment protein CcmL/EutN